MSKTSLAIDRRFLQRALLLAEKGIGLTLPNPRVGAVVVRAGKILGEGYHAKAGQPHAEVNAVQDALAGGHDLADSTLYVTLEPCSTHGRTPPCTDLILRHKIRRVVYAATDPNPAHAGAAAQLLRQAGVEVSSGICAEAAQSLNRDFNFWIVQGRPWVVGKLALSLDGRITTPEKENRWLTSPEMRLRAHQFRWEADAILVGAETVRQDNPHLTVRLPGRPGKEQPWRVVVTRSGNLPASAHLFTDEYKDRTLVFKNRPLGEVMSELGAKKISHVLLEGGGQLFSEALTLGLINEVAMMIAPAVMGTTSRALEKLQRTISLHDVRYESHGPDLLCRALVMPPAGDN